MANVNLREEGKSGLQAYSGIVNESYTTKLQWPAAYSVYDEMRRRERANILAALKRTKWKISGEDGAAELLGIKPTTLSSRMKKMGIERPV